MPTPLDIDRDFHDHETFCRESLAIRDKRGKTVPFGLQPAQKRLNALIEERRRKRRPIRIIVLKGRQVMISAGTAAEFFHDCAFQPGQKALVVAHEVKASENIFSYYQQLQDNYEPFRWRDRHAARHVQRGRASWNGKAAATSTSRRPTTSRPAARSPCATSTSPSSPSGATPRR